MKTIMKTKEGITLIRDERTNRFYSNNPKAMVETIKENLHSSNPLIRLCTEYIIDMIKSADGKIYRYRNPKPVIVKIVL